MAGAHPQAPPWSLASSGRACRCFCLSVPGMSVSHTRVRTHTHANTLPAQTCGPVCCFLFVGPCGPHLSPAGLNGFSHGMGAGASEAPLPLV